MCVRCGAEKPQSEYYANDRSCKECRKALQRAARARNIEHYREYDRNRAMNPERVKARQDYKETDAGKQSKAKTTIRYRKDNPVKYKAHTMVNNAIRDGLLLKVTNCEVCSADYRVEAHHDDYSKPLEVRWLCAKCHTEWHDEHGEALNG